MNDAVTHTTSHVMSTGWSIAVTVITIGMLVGCWLLLHLTRRGEIADGGEKDHEFDGIRELETPLPLWWYWMFMITLMIGVVYLALYPGLGNYRGLLGWTEVRQWEGEVAAADARYAPMYTRYAATAPDALGADPAAMKMAGRLFGNYCAPCHGSDGRGGFGFPDLTDDTWLWGSDAASIRATIEHGRVAAMPAWGAALGDDGVTEVVAHVRGLAGLPHDADAAARGGPRYAMFCVACHGPDGRGNVALGAPDLTDGSHLYGADPEQLAFTIRNGRNGVMPGHAGILSADRMHLLTGYVLQLGDPADGAGAAR